MPDKTITIPYGDGMMSFQISSDRLDGVYSPNRVEPLADVNAAFAAALDAPVGCPSLSQMLQQRAPERLVIVVDDITRHTPVHLVLPQLLDICNAAGVPDARIKGVLALGTHRAMTDDEILHKVGPEAIARIPFINPRYDDPDDLVHYGQSECGVDIWINRTYAEADFTIAISNIIPHGAVGFSGGAKIIYPGVAGRKTVTQFHQAANGNPENVSGRIDTPIRRDIEEMAARVGLDFLACVVTTPKDEIAGITAGDFVQAHRQGVTLSQQVYGIRLARRPRIAVASSFPANLDLWQAAKCVFNCQGVVPDGGWLVMVTPCPEGVCDEHSPYDGYIGMDPADLLAGIEAGTFDDPIAAAPAVCMARFRERIHIGVVSHGLSRESVGKMRYHHFDTVEHALDHIFATEGSHPVAVFTHGGEAVPFVE